VLCVSSVLAVSAGMVSAGTVPAAEVAEGTVSADLIPDGTDRIRPNAAAAMNTMTTPSAKKKPSYSMIRM
jgi:predicted nicotinamide N-methyase